MKTSTDIITIAKSKVTDVTEHNMDKHSVKAKHAPEWYALFTNKCPDCDATAKHIPYTL